MDTITRTTRFKNLPEHIKRRLIALYTRTKHACDIRPVTFDTSIFSALSNKLTDVHTYELTRNYQLLVRATDNGDAGCNVDIGHMARVYNDSLCERDLIGKLVNCVSVMSGKYMELKRVKDRKRNVHGRK